MVAACKDDCVTNLSENAKKWFADLGSQEIYNLEYRQSFVFIGITGQKENCQEKRGTLANEQVQITQVFSTNHLQLAKTKISDDMNFE